ncbi:DUF721 domain-containing protein [Uruburuella testudinis]|uniref:DUF721 domain-containing protein n=1 Tax=Uruburuella testudinis TaxID=1282863 RepID=A0ABY4DUV0_9NEIS|nr:DUF721 domain-containing protein [Uruburuella testudinis]UOO82631.1 DUF721 domain-containing protein [Uruburuella testudinis]
MNLDRLGARKISAADYNHIQRLIAQAKQWRRLDAAVKNLLPPNLRDHVQTACIEEGCLILLTANNMAASRLRMMLPALLPQLRNLNPHITDARTKLVPKPPAPVRENRLHMSEAALAALNDSAQRLQHHPELAEALQNLVRKQRK